MELDLKPTRAVITGKNNAVATGCIVLRTNLALRDESAITIAEQPTELTVLSVVPLKPY